MVLIREILVVLMREILIAIMKEYVGSHYEGNMVVIMKELIDRPRDVFDNCKVWFIQTFLWFNCARNISDERRQTVNHNCKLNL